MKIARGLNALRSYETVATIGNFDGLHLGHQSMIKHLVLMAKELKVPSTLITFEPYPKEYFLHERAQGRLMRFTDKVTLLKRWGVDCILRLTFDELLSRMQASDFLETCFQTTLSLKGLVVGSDFRFGYQRLGDTEYLNAWCKAHQIQFMQMSTVMSSMGQRISSTQIRMELARGNLRAVAALLGRNLIVTGRVAHGNARGRAIGVPTANLYLRHNNMAFRGVYCVLIHGLDKVYRGIANCGLRPTIGGNQYVLEAHLFDYDDSLYGKRISVELVKFIRPEIKFSSFDELVVQIKEDMTQAKSFWATEHC